MKQFWFFILLISTISLKAQKSPEFKHFKIDIDAKRTSFFDAVEHVEIIRLEETENSLMSYLEWYRKTPNGIAIINKMSKTVLLFDDNGNYKNVINNSGQGPEEYINISDAWFRNGKIELFSGRSRAIFRYTEEGEYIDNVKAKYSKELSGGAMVPYQDGYAFINLNPSISPGVDTNYTLIFTDSQLNMVGKGARVFNPNPFPLNLGKHFRFFGKSLFYKKILSDSVYQVIDGKAYPRYKFDFEDQWAWSDPKSTASQQIALKIMGEGDKVYDVLPDIGEKYIMLCYYSNIKNRETGYIDRKTGEFFRFDLRKKDKENYDLKFLQWEDDRLVSSIAAYDFEEFIENLDDNQWTVKGGFSLEEILSSENPVLLKIKFK